MGKILVLLYIFTLFLIFISVYELVTSVFKESISEERKKELLENLEGEEKERMLKKIKRINIVSRIFFILMPFLIGYFPVIPTIKDTPLFLTKTYPAYKGYVVQATNVGKSGPLRDFYIETEDGEIIVYALSRKLKKGDSVCGHYYPFTKFGTVEKMDAFLLKLFEELERCK